ncbi:MAG: UDP-3-O-(3-hydroxymyristoyl)glucosamine N-acyltransferase [Bacteroidales bacterium]
MEIKAQIIADHLKGEIIGDPEVKVSTVAKIENGKPGAICFLTNPKYEHYLYTTKASIILINKTFKPKSKIDPTLILVDDAYQAVASLLELLNTLKKKRRRGHRGAHLCRGVKLGKGTYVGRGTYISKSAQIGKNCEIYPQVFIGENCKIGNDVILFPGVKIYEGCKIGNNCTFHANVVIGSDGFGFAPVSDGSYKKIPQTGIVEIQDYVEIGANTVVDRATMGQTLIEKGVKLDNLIQIAHNVTIGTNTVIAAQSGVSGSTKIGPNCMIGGQVGFAGHLFIAAGAQIAAQSGIMGNVKKEGSTLMGSPAFNYKDYLKAYAKFKN